MMALIITKRVQMITLLLFLTCAWQGVAVAASVEDRFVDVDELIRVLKSENIDEIVKTLNVIKQMKYQGEILSFVEALWSQKEGEHKDLPWSVINKEIVRLNLANILVQAKINGKIDIDTGEIHDYAVLLMESKDKDIVISTIMLLSLLDRKDDVPLILAVAMSEQKATYRASVVALARMCNPAASQAIAGLQEHIMGGQNRAFLTETVDRMQTFKNRTGVCGDIL